MTSNRTYLGALAALLEELLRWMARERLGSGAGYMSAWARVWGQVSAAWPRGVERRARLAGRSATGVCACHCVPCRCARSVGCVEFGAIRSPQLVRSYSRIGAGRRCPDGSTRRRGYGQAWCTPGETHIYGASGSLRVVEDLLGGAHCHALFVGRFWVFGLVFTPRTGLRARDLGVVRAASACAQGPPGGGVFAA